MLAALRTQLSACSPKMVSVQKKAQPEGCAAEATGTLWKRYVDISWLPCPAQIDLAATVPTGGRVKFQYENSMVVEYPGTLG